MIAKLHYISQGSTPKEHLENIQQACQAGAQLVQLRLKEVSEQEILDTALKARKITAISNTSLIINDHYQVAKEVNADGVHLGKTDTCPTIARQFLGDPFVIGGTANTLEDCQALIEKQVNYIGLGPFRFTSTKKNLSPVLGTEGYQRILQALTKPTPIIAIGGITLEDIPQIMQTGVHGIAISGAITQNFQLIQQFQQLIDHQPISN